MGRRGPAPKPTALRLLDGGRNPQRLNKHEPIPRDGLPTPPETMSEQAREVWDYTVRELVIMKTVASADRDTLACYCEAVVNHRKATAILDKGEVVIAGLHGGPVRNPALAVQRDSAELIRKFAQEFGLTPSGRTRIHAMEAGRGKDEQDNPFAATP